MGRVALWFASHRTRRAETPRPVRLSSANAGRQRTAAGFIAGPCRGFFMRSSFPANLLIGCAHARYSRLMPPLIETEQVVVIDYTNHAGKRSMRRILPVGVWFGSSQYHAAQVGPQWYLRALDIDKADPENPRAALPERDFLFTSIHESMTLDIWELRSRDDERWRLQQQAWQNAQR